MRACNIAAMLGDQDSLLSLTAAGMTDKPLNGNGRPQTLIGKLRLVRFPMKLRTTSPVIPVHYIKHKMPEGRRLPVACKTLPWPMRHGEASRPERPPPYKVLISAKGILPAPCRDSNTSLPGPSILRRPVRQQTLTIAPGPGRGTLD